MFWLIMLFVVPIALISAFYIGKGIWVLYFKKDDPRPAATQNKDFREEDMRKKEQQAS